MGIPMPETGDSNLATTFDYIGEGLPTPTPRIDITDRREGEGYVYVLAFGDIVKVGTAKSPRRRIDHHRKSHMHHEGILWRAWVSSPHLHEDENEDALIAFCKSKGKRWGWKQEFFTGVDVEAVIAFAKSLPGVRAAKTEQFVLVKDGVEYLSVRGLALLSGIDPDEGQAEYDRQQLIRPGRFVLPPSWLRGSKEMQAKHGTSDFVDLMGRILADRGLA